MRCIFGFHKWTPWTHSWVEHSQGYSTRGCMRCWTHDVQPGDLQHTGPPKNATLGAIAALSLAGSIALFLYVVLR